MWYRDKIILMSFLIMICTIRNTQWMLWLLQRILSIYVNISYVPPCWCWSKTCARIRLKSWTSSWGLIQLLWRVGIKIFPKRCWLLTLGQLCAQQCFTRSTHWRADNIRAFTLQVKECSAENKQRAAFSMPLASGINLVWYCYHGCECRSAVICNSHSSLSCW